MGYFSDKGKEIIPVIIDSERKLNDDFTIITINHKEGLINNKFKTIIKPKYDNISFTERDNGIYEETDLAKIKLNDKYGFIDKNGQVILEPKYDLIFQFNNKLAIVKKIDKFGLINSEGKELLAPIYDELYDF